MIFSSVTPFLDHHNWHQQLQQSNHQQGSGGGSENPNFQPPPPPPTQRGGDGGGGELGSIRAGSMVDRARLAKLPMPEPGLNCPRCDSTNTKFCYFNNYSLTQPRHFCKTCRRYWTRGGALRNVPVGGGCRRNKRSNKRSKSPTQKGGTTTTTTKSVSESSPSRCTSTENITTTTTTQLSSLQLPFMSSYGGNNITYPQNEMFHLGSGGNNLNNILSIGSGESWRLPFLAGFEVPNTNNTNLFHYQTTDQSAVASSMIIDNSRTTPAADPPVKVEENRGLNLSRQILDNTNQQQAWPAAVGNMWADQFSGVNASSTMTPTTHFI